MDDPSANFGEAAQRYQAFRPAYPDAVFQVLQQTVKSGRAHAVDLGAGTGQASRRLAGIFDHVTAVEPDARLAAEARLPENVTLNVESAERVSFDHNSLDAVICATAFHWMDQLLICNRVSQWLNSGGAFFPFAVDAFDVKGRARSFYEAEFDKWRAYRDRRLVENYDYHRIVDASGAFSRVTPFRQTSHLVLDATEAAGLVSTFSFARDYARANGGDPYFRYLKETFQSLGDRVEFSVPIVGAIGLKT
ncbi:MAG: class I SAM-dependent methyltransferase [Pseudomonadota bacterium]